MYKSFWIAVCLCLSVSLYLSVLRVFLLLVCFVRFVFTPIQAYPFSFWLKTFALTAVAWTARFMVVNLLFWAWAPAANGFAVFARQLVVWVSMEALPTPGGSGASEWMFKEYYGDLVSQGSILVVVTIIWRLLTYYVYLLLGVLVTPKWLHKPRKKLTSY